MQYIGSNMELRDLISYIPNELQPTIVDNEADYQKSLEEQAEKLGKKVDDLTEAEKQDAKESFMASNGLTSLDFMIP